MNGHAHPARLPIAWRERYCSSQLRQVCKNLMVSACAARMRPAPQTVTAISIGCDVNCLDKGRSMPAPKRARPVPRPWLRRYAGTSAITPMLAEISRKTGSSFSDTAMIEANPAHESNTGLTTQCTTQIRAAAIPRRSALNRVLLASVIDSRSQRKFRCHVNKKKFDERAYFDASDRRKSAAASRAERRFICGLHSSPAALQIRPLMPPTSPPPSRRMIFGKKPANFADDAECWDGIVSSAVPNGGSGKPRGGRRDRDP